MVKVLGVAFAARQGGWGSPAHQAFEVLEREGWQPQTGSLELMVAPSRWWGALQAIETAAGGYDAVMLFGKRGRKTRARVARFARNESRGDLHDDAGFCWPGGAVAPGGPLVIGATLAPERLALAMELAGLPSKASAKSDGYVYNQCFYRLLANAAAPLLGLVRLPQSIENARNQGRLAHANRMQIVAGVAAALSFAAAAAESRAAPHASPRPASLALAKNAANL